MYEEGKENKNIANDIQEGLVNEANITIDDEIEDSIEFDESLPDYELPRPSYYLLQILGMWKPSNAYFVQNLYQNVLIPCLWLFSLVGILARSFIDYGDFRWGRLLNSCGNILGLASPYILCHHYFYFGRYAKVVTKVMFEDRDAVLKLKRLSKYYTIISIAFWLLAFTFFFAHYESVLFLSDFYLVFYVILLFLCTGWWGLWLSMYGFVCSVLKVQIEYYLKLMKDRYGYSTRTVAAEEDCIRELLAEFIKLRNNISQSQTDFNKIITFSVFFYLVDTVVFSIAYWKHDFRDFPLYVYVLGILFDFVSIIFKLYPAAIVNQTLHQVVRVSGEHCYPDIDVGETPKQRFVFYQFLYLHEQDIGIRILGLKITSRLTVGLLVTIGTLSLAFLHYIVPFLKNLSL